MTDRIGGGFHAAHWDEPLIDEIPGDGGRGLLPPKVDDAIADAVGDVAAALPEGVRAGHAAGAAPAAAAPGAPALSAGSRRW